MKILYQGMKIFYQENKIIIIIHLKIYKVSLFIINKRRIEQPYQLNLIFKEI